MPLPCAAVPADDVPPGTRRTFHSTVRVVGGRDSLPITGPPVPVIGGIALLLLGAGAVTVRATRRTA